LPYLARLPLAGVLVTHVTVSTSGDESAQLRWIPRGAPASPPAPSRMPARIRHEGGMRDRGAAKGRLV